MLYRIEIKDKSGDWRGLFRAHPREWIGDVLQSIAVAHRAPAWHTIELSREPEFYFTDRAWHDFACRAYIGLVKRLKDDVRFVTLHESDPNAHALDSDQWVYYRRPTFNTAGSQATV